MIDWLGLPQIWDQVVDFFTISAFWYYLFWGVVIAAGSLLLAYLFPPLRSLAGAIVVAIATGLFAYRRGEKDAEERERKRKEKEAQRQQRRETQQPWKWPWE